MIRNGAMIFKYRKNIFQREISNILANQVRQDLNYNVNLLDKAVEKTIVKLSINKTLYEKSIKNKWFNRQLEVLKKEKNKI